MNAVLHAILGTVLVFGTFGSVLAGSCSGAVGGLTLSEDETTSNLYAKWLAPSGESGCTYTVTYTTNAPDAKTESFETEDLQYVIDQKFLVPCSIATVTVSTSDGPSSSAEIELEIRTSTAPILLDMVTSCDSIEMTWEGQSYVENMCVHTHFQLFCLSDTHNFTIAQQVHDESNRLFHVILNDSLHPDIFYTCNGYMFVTLGGFTPASTDIQFWSNLDTVRDLQVSESETAIRATWEPPQNSEDCGVAYHVIYENEVLGEQEQDTTELFVDLNAEIVPCTEYKVSVTPVSYTGSLGTYVSATYTPEVTQGSVADIDVADDGETLTLSWTPINIGKCDIQFVVEHYVNDELVISTEVTDNSIILERIPCSANRFEVSVVTNGEPGTVVSSELELSADDIQEISDVQNLVVSGNVASWDAPVSVGRCGVEYEITHEDQFGVSTTSVIAQYEADLTLIPCSENVVSVRGVVGSLVGEAVSVNFVADAADLEGPETLKIIPDFTAAALTLRAEGKEINSCPITQALVTCTKDGGDDAFGDNIDVLDNDERVFQLDLAGLETDTIYNCKLRWANSEMGSEFRFRTIPIPNKQLSVTDVSSSGFNVVWSEDYGEEFVLSYELVINSHGPLHDVKDGCEYESEKTFTFPLEAGTELQAFVDGFPDYDYDIALQTVYNLGSMGVTDESEGLNTQTLQDAPGLPEDIKVDFEYEAGAAYDVTGVISWTAPCQLNGPLRSFGVNVAVTFDLGGTEQTIDYDLDVEASSPNGAYEYRLEEINPFFKYVVSVNTLAAVEGPTAEIVINPPDICSCTEENGAYEYRLEEINPFFKYVFSVNTLAALEGPNAKNDVNPPDICSCAEEP